MSNRFSRRGDPSTSRAAGAKAGKEIDRAIAAVRQLMADGVGRTDDEVEHLCRAAQRQVKTKQKKLTADRFRHGRLHLSESGYLILTGAKRATSRGGDGRIWRLRRPEDPPPPRNASIDPDQRRALETLKALAKLVKSQGIPPEALLRVEKLRAAVLGTSGGVSDT